MNGAPPKPSAQTMTDLDIVAVDGHALSDT
jgi:hypothetical protein